MKTSIQVFLAAAIGLAAADSSAQPGEEEQPTDGAVEAKEEQEPTPTDDSPVSRRDDAPRDGALRTRIDELQAASAKLKDENQELREEIELLREDLQATDERVDGLLPLKSRLSGYLDFGFFSVAGDGTGIRSDIGNLFFPEYGGQVAGSWVFMGDPLSTAVNYRGEPAETGESRAITFDAIDNEGTSSFIVNALNLQFFSGVGDTLSLSSSVDFVPRGRNVSDPDGLFLGDFLDIKLAYLTYRAPIEAFGLEVYAGKFESVLGREYRRMESPDMISVTPSLLCRYLCGRPLGVKSRLLFFGDKLTAMVAVTNGSQFWESFAFYDEIDANQVKTGSARVAVRLPVAHSELGVSGAFGAQDQQTANDRYQWHVGADLFVSWQDLELTLEYIQGKAKGESEADPGVARCTIAPCLTYKGAYGLVSYRITNNFVPYARVDWRDATHQDGASFVYLSKLMRATAGLRTEIGTSLILKAEYTLNRELGGIPQFPNNVFTTAMVLKY